MQGKKELPKMFSKLVNQFFSGQHKNYRHKGLGLNTAYLNRNITQHKKLIL